jgi:UDP-GlcNAc:undecaprenyl-phosphate GlcNAc-1-phosphate transferase
MKTYLAVYLVSLLLSAAITQVIIRIAHLLKIYDKPGIRKVHAYAIPRVGGVALFLSSVILVITVLFINNRIGALFRKAQAQILTMFVSGTFIFIVGLIDDLHNLKARNKLLAQMVAASALYFAGIKIVSLNFANLFTINFGGLSFFVTIFWVLAITNAVNLIDGLDGLAAGISAVTCAVIAVFAFERELILMAVLMVALLGSLTGFLLYNFNPARIFMGDCGSMFLGFMLAAASISCAAKTGTMVALALPVLALGLPIFDTFFSIIRRYLSRRGIMSPDRSHLHHKLLDLGLQHRHVVITMYVLTLCAAGLGMFMMLAQGLSVLVIFLSVLLLLVLVFRACGAIRFRETITTWKRKHTVGNQVRQEREGFDAIELYFHQAGNFDNWWNAVCFAADKMDFIKGTLPLINRDGARRTLGWEKTINNTGLHDIIAVAIPIHDRRANSNLKLELEINTNGSIESVGRRLALFGRLLEDYSLVQLKNEAVPSFGAADNILCYDKVESLP